MSLKLHSSTKNTIKEHFYLDVNLQRFSTEILDNSFISQSQHYYPDVMASDFSTHPSTITSNSSDLELFYAIREGEVNALKILYNRYVALVYNLALKILGNSEEAEDLTQEIFLKLWNQNTYQPSRGSLRACK